MTVRRGWRFLLGGLMVIIVILGCAVLILTTVDLRPIIERRLTDSLGRQVKIGSLDVKWGSPTTLRLNGLTVSDPPWGTQPDMLRIDSAVAEVVPWALFRGVLDIRALTIDGAALLLERGPNHIGNWNFRGSKSPPLDIQESARQTRAHFPTLNDVSIHNATMIYQGSADPLRMQIAALTINAPADDQPITLQLTGSYNGAAGRLSVSADSFHALRSASSPLKTVVKIETENSTAEFDGTMVDPLNFDGLAGILRLDAHALANVLAFFGAQPIGALPIRASGTFTRNKAAWKWADVKGELGGHDFNGRMELAEGEAAAADAVTLALTLTKLDAKALIGGSSGAEWRTTNLQLNPHPGVTIVADVAATQLQYGTVELADFKGHGSLMPGNVTLSDLSFGLAKGQMQLSVNMASAQAGTHMRLNAALSGADVDQAARLIGASAGHLNGRLEARADMEMAGNTVASALKNSHAGAVLSVTQGQIARELMEEVSTDLRAIFRTREGAVRLTCLLGVLEMRNGIGVVSPLRLRTPEGIVIAGGGSQFSDEHFGSACAIRTGFDRAVGA